MTHAARSVLVVEDDERLRLLLADELRAAGYDVTVAANGESALAMVHAKPADLLITDVGLPGIDGEELLREVAHAMPSTALLVITGKPSLPAAVRAGRAGAASYLSKPFSMEELLSAAAQALDERPQTHLVQQEVSGRDDVVRIVAESAAMKRTLDLVLRAAATDAPVLLRGESGTGKELLARYLHERGRRRAHPMVAVNCAAIPEALLESQLFGHRRGAFTDARQDHKGLFVEADGGTLLLDEIGDMPPSLQVKLLRALQDGTVHPLGASGPVRADVRIVAATHRDPLMLVQAGLFREDLLYRLNVIGITVPPLRERPEDILPLAAHYLARQAERQGVPIPRLTAAARHALLTHAWPGNVRELQNALLRALALGRAGLIDVSDLPEQVRNRAASPQSSVGSRALADVEREHIVRTLQRAGGNKSVAARLLGMDRKTLRRKLASFEPGDGAP